MNTLNPNESSRVEAFISAVRAINYAPKQSQSSTSVPHPQQAPAPAIPPKPAKAQVLKVAPGVDYAWMHKGQQQAPTPAYVGQTPGELIRHAYGAKK